MAIVRFADDLVVGFQHRADAERFYADLRFARFGLELNAEKTRLIEFGRFAAENRRRRGLGRPETFSFLGFTTCVRRRGLDGSRCGGRRSPSEWRPSCAR
jgi:RNA-directed DNA polymerase